MSTQEGAYTAATQAGKSPRATRRRVGREEVGRARLLAQAATTEAVGELTRLGLDAFVQEVGLRGLEAGVELEAVALCGPKGRHDREREAVRYGHTRTSVRVMGRRVTILRPRVRRTDGSGEVTLGLWRAAQGDDEAMRRAVMGAAVRGVSQRGFGPTAASIIGQAAPGRTEFGNSSTTVNRLYVEASRGVLAEMMARPLTGGAYRVLYMDAIVYGGYRVVAAVGVRDDGEKEVLGIEEGSTENHVVCEGLIRKLFGRGLEREVMRLVVMDGGKGLRKAVEEAFGSWAVVQRCVAHKSRNLEAKVSQDQWTVIKRVVAKAWRQSEAAEAEQELATLARQLEEEGYKEAAGSLREGLRETLTVARLGLSRGLRRKLTTTNTIESAFSTVGRTARRVTNWQSGAQALRWVAVGLEAAQSTFRMSLSRVEVWELARALDRVAPNRQDDHAA